jgi:hypothetical protein
VCKDTRFTHGPGRNLDSQSDGNDQEIAMTGSTDGDGAAPGRAASGETEGWKKILLFLIVWGTAVMGALSFVSVSNLHDPRIWKKPGYPLEFGYTLSLILLYLPLVVLLWWYIEERRSDPDDQLKSLFRAVLYNTVFTSVVFVLFDIVFANLLFDFPDPNSVVGHKWLRLLSYVPGYKWDASSCSTLWTLYRFSCYSLSIPVEEVLFYLGGAAVLRGMYIWASEDFLSRYTVPPAEYERQAKACNRLIKWNWRLALVAVAIVIVGFALKRISHGNGIPTYLILQVFLVFVPLVFLYTKVSPFVNTRAFLLVMILQVLVSVIWEATLALPYGWWNYKPDGMTGRQIFPWSDLPVEACFFWISVGWSAMFIHEATKIKVRSGRTWWEVLTGSNRYTLRGLAGWPPREAERRPAEV